MKNLFTLNKFLRNPNLLYRVFGLVGAVFTPTFRWVFPEEAHDPMFLRWIISGLFLSISLLTLFPKIPQRVVHQALLVLVLGISGWLYYLLFTNGLSPDYTTTYVLLTITSFWILPSEKQLYFYLGINLLGMVCLTILVKDPVAPIGHIWLHTLFAHFIGMLVNHSRLINLHRYFEDTREIDYINYSAVGGSRDGILLVDNDGKFIRANENFFNLWGIYTGEDEEIDLVEMQIQAVEKVKDRPRFENLVNSDSNALEENQIEDFELKDGRFIEIYFIKTQMGNRPVGRLWFFRDITERRKMENSLKESERRLRQLNDSLTEMAGSPALLEGTLESSLTVVTQTMARILGAETTSIWFFDYDSQSMDCQTLFRNSSGAFESGHRIYMNDYHAYFDMVTRKRIFAVHDTRAHPIAEEFREGKNTGPTGSLVHAHIRSGDKIIGLLSVEETETRIWNVEEQSYIASMADLVAVSIEVSRRKEIRQQLERYSAILKATFDLSETGILVLDKDGNVVECNDLYLKTWNMSHDFLVNGSYEEKVQFNLNQLKNAEDIGKDAKLLRERPGMETAGVIEFQDGRVVERYSKGLIINGEIVGRVWFYLDITERKNRETELMNRNFELDSFVYRASHDLKAPLNSIMGLINIIREEKDVEAILRYIQMMDKSVTKLDAFIRQLTQFSQDTRLQIVQKPIDLEALILEVWEDLKYMDNASRVKLDLQVAQSTAFFSDPVRLNIVANNIISNAIKYQDFQRGQSTVEVLVQADENRAVIEFRDNGVGISKEHLEKVFELFFRASVQATGSGLGLYITYNAVGKLGGKIDVDSTPGIGTTFSLNIPNRMNAESNSVPDSSTHATSN